MPRGKKNPTTAASKTASKTAEPIKEKAAKPEKKTVTAEKKKVTAPKKAVAAKTSTKTTGKTRAAKKTSTYVDVKEENVSVKATEKAVPKTVKKAAAAKKTVAKTKTSASFTTAKKTAASKTGKKTVVKTEKKSAAPKRTVKKSAKGKSDEVVFQSGDRDYTLSEITQICKDAYRGGTRKQIKNIKVYVKAEGSKLVAYYVVNDSISGSVDL